MFRLQNFGSGSGFQTSAWESLNSKTKSINLQESWKEHFPRRDLVAYSVAPLLVFPTHYTGEKGYVSDTEDSVIIPDGLHSNQPREDL